MDLLVDNRKTDAMYVDKELSHVATNDNLIKFITKDCRNNLKLAVDLFAGVLRLNESEAETMYYINYLSDDNGQVSIIKTSDVFRSNTLKSKSTFDRAIESLKEKGIIYFTNKGKDICIKKEYNINVNAIDKAAFIVIEVKPEVSSQAVSIL